MLNKKLEKKLNDQITVELQSAYLYLSMAGYFVHEGYSGFAHWMKVQAKEEMGHASKIADFLSQVGSKVTLGALDAPRADFNSVRAVFELALKNEKDLSKAFNEMATLACDEGDHAGYSFVQWFVNEQVEEVATCAAILQKMDLLGTAAQTMYLLDRELGQRQG